MPGCRRLPASSKSWWCRCIGGSRDTTWLPGDGEQPGRQRPAGGTRIAARPAPPGPVLGGWRGGPAGHRRADWLLVREVAAADCGGYRGAAADGDHGEGRLPGPYLVGPDARGGVPGDAVRRVPIRPGIGCGSVGYRVPGRRFCTGGGSPGAVYISRLDVAAGQRVSNGEKLAEIDGEPLFALAGHVPAWRDITPGESGPDVAELQKALASLGYYAGRRHARVLRRGNPGRGVPVLRAPWLHPAGDGRRAADGRDLPAVAAREGDRGERRQRPAARPAVP